MTAPDRHRARVRRPTFLTFLAGLSNLVGVLTASISIAWALRQSEISLTPGEARMAGLIAACGLTGIVASHGLLRLRSDARSLQLILSSVWLVGWAVAALRGSGAALVSAMTPGAILAAASILYLSRESLSHVFATAPPDAGGRGVLIGDAVAIIFILLFAYPNFRNMSGRSPIKNANPEATFEKATALYRAENFAEAIPLFEEFLRARKDHPLAHARLGLSLSQVGRYDAAVPVLKRAIALDASDFHSRNNLALTYEKLGKPALGIDPAREAAQLKGDDAIVQNTLGFVLLRAGHPGEALEPLRIAARMQPQYVQVRWNLAHAYQQTGQGDRARSEVATLRKFDAKSADELQAELTKLAAAR